MNRFLRSSSLLILGLLAVGAFTGCQHLCPSTTTFRGIGERAGQSYGTLTEQELLGKVTPAKEAEAYAVWMDFRGTFMEAFKAKGRNWNAKPPVEVVRLGALFAYSVNNLQNP